MTKSYQWYYDGVAIGGATGKTHTLTSGQTDSNLIECRVQVDYGTDSVAALAKYAEAAPAGLTRQAATQLITDGTDSLTYSASHTASTVGSNRLFVACFAYHNGSSAVVTGVGVEFGGQALTQIQLTTQNGGQPELWAGYLLDADIPAGAQTLTVTITETGSDHPATAGIVNVIEYSGVDQATPIATSAVVESFGTSVTSTLTIANASSAMLAMGVRKTQGDTSTNIPWTTNNGSMLLGSETGTPTFLFGNISACSAEYLPGATGSASMVLTPAFTGDSDNISAVGMEIKAA